MYILYNYENGTMFEKEKMPEGPERRLNSSEGSSCRENILENHF